MIDFQALFDAAPTPMIALSPPDWTIVAANEARVRVTGMTRKEQVGRKLFEAFPDDPDDPHADGVRNLRASLERVMATKAPDTMAVQRYAVRGSDGCFEEHWWSPVNAPVLDEKGEVALVIHRVEEVTEIVRMRGEAQAADQLARDQQAIIERLRAAESALGASEMRYRQIVEGAEDFAIITLDERGTIKSWNSGAERITGFREAEAVDQSGAIFFTPEDIAAGAPDREMNRAHANRRAVDERWHQRKDGTRFWGSGLMMRLDAPAGGYLKIFRDRTAEHEAEATLRQTEARYRTLFENIDVGFCVLEMIFDGANRPVDYRFVEVNPAFERQTGLVDALGRTMRELVPAHEEHWFEIYGGVAMTGEPVRFENRAEGLGRWYEVYALRVGDPTGRRVACLFTDISGRRNAEERLRELNETLERQVEARTAELNRVWQNSRDLLIVVGADGVFRAVNPAWTEILGHVPSEVVGRSFLDFIWPDDAELTQGGLDDAAAARDLTSFENRYTHKDGSARWISWHTSVERDLVYGYGRDVTAEKERETELEQAREALRQAQKMEAVGQLTGGIAHDFNNMLAVVIGSLDLLGRRIGVADARAKRYVNAAADGARRAALLTQRLLAFSRQQPLQPEPMDANKLVAGISELIRGSLGSDIRLETVLASGLWRTHADPNQLENVLLNLAVNARDAMPDGGRLTIETQNAHLDARYVAAHLGMQAGQYVMVAVTDTGSGMPDDVIAKAFDPFFTTKGVGKGTGLGLSQVYGFVKQSGGHVKIYSEPGQGTTVKVYLPRLLGAEHDGPDDEDAASLPLGEAQEVILVVEDELAVRQFSVDALSELGYRVLEADGAATALRLLDAHPAIALLFTDVVMPDVNGRKLADEARQRRPDLRVLFTTGYTRNAVVHNGVLDPGVELIGKLAAKVREILDATADAQPTQVSPSTTRSRTRWS